MVKILKRLNYFYNISKRLSKVIFYLPIIATIILGLLLFIPFSRNFGFWLLSENHPVEILTFIIFIIGGIYGILNAVKNFKILGVAPAIFFTIFSIFLILIAMEEIAWGQWIFHFDTPSEWSKINIQKETTLHNLNGLQGNLEVLRLIFGIGGLIGILIRKHPLFAKIGAPAILLPWFVIIIIHSLTFHIILDGFNDYIKSSNYFEFVLLRTTEFIELLIAVSAFLYIWLNNRIFDKNK